MGLFTALLLGFLVAGCGSGSDGSFVATPGEGGNNNNATTGSVTFNFVQAQSPITVPVGTTNLRFEFFTDLGGTGSLVLREERAYAGTITIEGVPTTARSVVVTAYDASGFPISEFTANVSLVANGNVTVGAASGTSVPVTLTGITSSPLSLSLGLNGSVALRISAVFSNGDSVEIAGDALAEVTFSSSDTTVATVDNAGLVSAALTGDAVITAVFRGQTVAVPVSVSTGNVLPPVALDLDVDPASVTLPAGTRSQAIEVTATFEGGVQRVVTTSQGVVFTSNVVGVTVDPATQQVVVGNNVPGATTAIVTATYLGQSAQVEVNVVAATLQSISVSPTSVSLPFGGFEQRLAVTGQFSNGATVQIDPSNLTFSDDSALFTVDPSGNIVTTAGGTPGDGTVFISTLPPLAAFDLEVDVQVGAIFIQSLQTSPSSPVTLTPGGFVEFQVIATLSSGGTVNVTDFGSLQIVLNDATNSAVINGNRIVAVDATNPDPSVTFTLPGAGNGGADVSTVVSVIINEITLTSAQYLFAGNPVSGNEGEVNLPRGYVGVVEVIGTFSNGTERKLIPDEYTLDQVPGFDATQAVEFFNSSYVPPAVNPFYLDPNNIDALNEFPRTPDPMAARSTFTSYAVKDTFRAVVADWRRGERGPGGEYMEAVLVPGSPNSGNVGNFDVFEINIDNDLEPSPGAFTQRLSVTVTDPDTFQNLSSDSGVFPNYAQDGNIPTNVAREFEIRVNFNARTPNDQGINIVDEGTRPPSVLPQQNFKIAEANLLFESDFPGFNPGLLVHRPTATGYVALSATNPVALGVIDIFVQPIGGIGGRTQEDPTSTSVPPARLVAQDQFGPSFALSWVLSPAPAVILGSVRTATSVDNNGVGFDVLLPSLLTLDPIGPLNLPVGAGQLFRTLVQYPSPEGQPQQPAADRSLDYQPYISAGEGTTVVGAGDLASGRVTVSAVASGNATVRVRDVTGADVNPRGTTFTDSNGVTGAPTTNVSITVP